ncbi:hypothetical protein JQC67_08075 [Aurantibacter crassamenti]|uniref:transglutaminase domain-containing protein n=1 Tax=Aurantibacter crassamenti TaxID=1837375 RepID=UPI00193A04F4|nr:hypothetical protein [Aurantibacter crassamenti]MBM1106088.1 hypothetical protein [Aurantibacter crassamenti]
MRIAFTILFLISSLAYCQRTDFDTANFNKADSIAQLYYGESLKNFPILSHKLTKDLKLDVEKFRSIYTWVCMNIENDYSSYLRTTKKRKKLAKDRDALLEWNKNHVPKVLNKLVKERKTACTGYAFLLRELADLAGLNCKIIDGFGRTATLTLDANSLPNHSWNAIELNGKWYLCDPTWSAGRIILEEDGPQFESNYFDGYFLADPRVFVKNHYPLELKWTLLNKPPSFNEYIKGPIVYKEAFNPQIIPLTPEHMRFETVKNKTVVFTIESIDGEIADNVQLQIDAGNGNRSTIPKITTEQNKLLLDHVFTKTGVFDVHIQVADAIIATYVVKVKRK